jgi:hypothetical protein
LIREIGQQVGVVAERLGELSGDVLGFHRLRSLLWMDECGSSRHTVSGEQNVVFLGGNAVTLLVEAPAGTTIGSRQ